MKIKLIEEMNEKYNLIHCGTQEEWDLVVKAATEQFEHFAFNNYSYWNNHGVDTHICVGRSTYGRISAYQVDSEIEFHVFEAKDVIKTEDKDPEYFL